jgi:hypothetical protein
MRTKGSINKINDSTFDMSGAVSKEVSAWCRPSLPVIECSPSLSIHVRYSSLDGHPENFSGADADAGRRNPLRSLAQGVAQGVQLHPEQRADFQGPLVLSAAADKE